MELQNEKLLSANRCKTNAMSKSKLRKLEIKKGDYARAGT